MLRKSTATLGTFMLRKSTAAFGTFMLRKSTATFGTSMLRKSAPNYVLILPKFFISQDRQFTYYCGAFANHCYRGKEISITHLSVCVRVFARVWVSGRVGVCMRVGACGLSYRTCNAYMPYFVVICSFFFPPYFSTLSHKRCDFQKTRYWTCNVYSDFIYSVWLKRF